jgi:hypothetical protein
VSATHSIRAKLIQVVLTLIIPGWIAMAVVIVSFYREERAHLLENTIGISRALMSAVDRDLISSITTTEILANTVSLRSDDFSAFHRKAASLLPLGIGHNFVLSDRSGQHSSTRLCHMANRCQCTQIWRFNARCSRQANR